MPGGKSEFTRSQQRALQQATEARKGGGASDTTGSSVSVTNDKNKQVSDANKTASEQQQSRRIGAFVKREMKNIIQDLVTKKEIQETQGKLREWLETHLEERLEKHLVTVKQEVEKMLQDSGGQEGNLQTGSHEKLDAQTFQKAFTRRVQDYIKENIYSNMKFCEKNHIDFIYSKLTERKEMRKPNGIDDEVYQKGVKTLIRQGFGSLRHNSQTLMRKNFIGKYWSVTKQKRRCNYTSTV